MVLDDYETSPVPFHRPDSLSRHNALFTMFTMTLVAKYNVSQTAIDNLVSSTSILLNAQLDHLKNKLLES